MSQERVNSPCPICDERYIKRYRENGLTFEIDCERCGKYKIDRRLLDDKPWHGVRHLVSAWVRRENKAGITPDIGKGVDLEDVSNPEWWKSRFTHMGFPKSIIDKLDALLLSYSDMVKSDYKKQISYGLPHLIAEIAAKNVDELNGLIDLLKEMGYVDEHPRITAKGWIRIDELRKTILTSDSAFIAMWFSDVTKDYRQVVAAAVEYCGYRPIIVDQEEYSDFIMDKVISLLRQAKFVIADFTSRSEEVNNGGVQNGVRGGVYWESGMAYGLEKPLIHTCEDSSESKARIHFDVDQYNTIYWKQDDLDTIIRPIEEANQNPTFAEKLAARILALAGQGSYKPE
jgi:hypothetical protein